MSKKKIFIVVFVMIVTCVIGTCVFMYQPNVDNREVQLEVSIQSTGLSELQYYYVLGNQEHDK